MTDIVLDQASISRFREAKEYLRFCDNEGHVLGYFVPIDPAKPRVIFGVKSPLSADERERRSKETGGKTLDEFWSEMKQKHPDKFK
jgi:hypothetical protein